MPGFQNSHVDSTSSKVHSKCQPNWPCANDDDFSLNLFETRHPSNTLFASSISSLNLLIERHQQCTVDCNH